MSDVTLRDLPAEGTFLAMQKEIRGLTAVGAGQVLAASASLAQGGLPTRKRKLRKVCAPESLPKISSGQSARSMGISSPTPSIEALRMVLGVACGA